MPSKALVVDANILVRAVLGTRVRALIETYSEDVAFFVPEAAYAEAEEHLSTLVIRRGGDPEKALALLQALRRLVDPIGSDVYGEFEAEARERLGQRDPEDWPILAAALALRCAIWTEDTDFFGCGVATWTSNRVRMFLRECHLPSEDIPNLHKSNLFTCVLFVICNLLIQYTENTAHTVDSAK